MPEEVDEELVEVEGGAVAPQRDPMAKRYRKSEVRSRVLATGGDEAKLYELAARMGYRAGVVHHWKHTWGHLWR